MAATESRRMAEGVFSCLGVPCPPEYDPYHKNRSYIIRLFGKTRLKFYSYESKFKTINKVSIDTYDKSLLECEVPASTGINLLEDYGLEDSSVYCWNPNDFSIVATSLLAHEEFSSWLFSYRSKMTS